MLPIQLLATGDDRTMLNVKGKHYQEMMISTNYDGGLDLYTRRNDWPLDTWAIYKITHTNDPLKWAEGMAMTFHSKITWHIKHIPSSMA